MSPVSKRLILSYVLDWFVIVAIAAIGGGLNFVTPYRRPFSLLDLSISFPHVQESISTPVLVVIALLAPAAIIAAIVLAAIPSRTVSRYHPSRNNGSSSSSSRNRNSTHIPKFMRIKLWELHAGLAGLCLSVAAAFFATQALKQLFGKPRPDLLSRCQPDVANIAAHIVGGAAAAATTGALAPDPRWGLVDASICTNPDTAVLNDGFRSFPSGHASFAWSGLLYLTLYFCAKFGVAIPTLPQPVVHPLDFLQRYTSRDSDPSAAASGRKPQTPSAAVLSQPNDSTSATTSTSPERNPKPSAETPEATPAHSGNPSGEGLHQQQQQQQQGQEQLLRNRPATPPNYLLVPALTPAAVAVYVASTRYAEFYHFGFDIIAGALLGLGSAWAAVRWYHAPGTPRGAGGAWGVRSGGRAFGGVVIGAVGGYAEEGVEGSGDLGWLGGDLEERRGEAKGLRNV